MLLCLDRLVPHASIRPLLLLAVPALALTGCGGQAAPSGAGGSSTVAPSAATPSTTDSTASAAPSSPAGASCLGLATGMSREQQIGQLFMVGTEASHADAALQQVVERHHVGSVIYLGTAERSRGETAAMGSRMSGWASGEVGLLVAVDQEGGQVQRLKGSGFSDMPSALTQSELSDEALRTSWLGWGKELRAAGVRYDLAPVADVVPADMASANEPIGALRRGYGATDEQAGAKAAAVIQGLSEAGVASSVKHYPGLGRVTTNTDFGSATDTVTTLDDTQSFRTAMAAGPSSVMVSSTIYSRIDPDVHAVFSSRIITDGLRGRDGWDKVVISDDMGAAAAVADVPAKERAVRFLAAGGDLVINADAGLMDQMVAGVEERAEADQAFAEALPTHVARVLELKAQVGLVECSR